MAIGTIIVTVLVVALVGAFIAYQIWASKAEKEEKDNKKIQSK